jgi:hypothetical protein
MLRRGIAFLPLSTSLRKKQLGRKKRSMPCLSPTVRFCWWAAELCWPLILSTLSYC